MTETSLKKFLYPQQLEAYEKLLAEKGGCVFWDVGQGKTRIALATMWQLTQPDGIGARQWPMPRGIIIICRRPAFDDWRNEIATLQFDWAVEEVENVDARKALESDTFILCSDGKLQNQITVATLQQLVRFQQAKGLIIDEGYLFSNHQTIRHKAVRTLSCKVPTVLLSGSLMSRRDLIQVYNQVAAAGKALRLAPNPTRFRTLYQTGIQGNFFTWYPKPGSFSAIMSKIESFTHVYFPDPKKGAIKTSILRIRPTRNQQSYFQELKETYAVEGVTEFNHAATLIIKTQQISNGWLKGDSGDVLEFPSTKIDRCLALVEEIRAAEKRCVIWCAFRYDIDRLYPLIQSKSCNVATFRSGEDFDTAGWHANEYQVCLATEASGSSVNHFAQVPYGIYFSQDFKWMSLRQSKGRHTRKSSKHEVTYFYFLHTDGSMDARIYNTVRISAGSEQSFIRAMDVQQWLKT